MNNLDLTALAERWAARTVNQLVANAELEGGRWVTTDSGKKMYIKDGDAVAGNPHVVSAAQRQEGHRSEAMKLKSELTAGRKEKSWHHASGGEIERNVPVHSKAEHNAKVKEYLGKVGKRSKEDVVELAKSLGGREHSTRTAALQAIKRHLDTDRSTTFHEKTMRFNQEMEEDIDQDSVDNQERHLESGQYLNKTGSSTKQVAAMARKGAKPGDTPNTLGTDEDTPMKPNRSGTTVDRLRPGEGTIPESDEPDDHTPEAIEEGADDMEKYGAESPQNTRRNPGKVTGNSRIIVLDGPTEHIPWLVKNAFTTNDKDEHGYGSYPRGEGGASGDSGGGAGGGGGGDSGGGMGKIGRGDSDYSQQGAKVQGRESLAKLAYENTALKVDNVIGKSIRSVVDKDARDDAVGIAKGIFARMTLGMGPLAIAAAKIGGKIAAKSFDLIVKGMDKVGQASGGNAIGRGGAVTLGGGGAKGAAAQQSHDDAHESMMIDKRAALDKEMRESDSARRMGIRNAYSVYNDGEETDQGGEGGNDKYSAATDTLKQLHALWTQDPAEADRFAQALAVIAQTHPELAQLPGQGPPPPQAPQPQPPQTPPAQAAPGPPIPPAANAHACNCDAGVMNSKGTCNSCGGTMVTNDPMMSGARAADETQIAAPDSEPMSPLSTMNAEECPECGGEVDADGECEDCGYIVENANPEGVNQYFHGAGGGSHTTGSKVIYGSKKGTVTGSGMTHTDVKLDSGEHVSVPHAHLTRNAFPPMAAGAHGDGPPNGAAPARPQPPSVPQPPGQPQPSSGHGATTAATSASIQAGPVKLRSSPLAALQASHDDDPEAAAGHHVSSAEEHEEDATEARKTGDLQGAKKHDEAAFLHRKAASVHQATPATMNRIHDSETNMPLTLEQRTYLIDNCDCSEAAKGALHTLSDRDLRTLARNAKAEGSNADATGEGELQVGGDGDEEDGGRTPGQKVEETTMSGAIAGKGKGGGATANTRAEQRWLASAPPRIQGIVSNALALEQQHKTHMVNQLTVNVRDPNIKQKLQLSLINEPAKKLEDMLLMLPVRNSGPAYSPNPGPVANYLGAASPVGPSPTYNASDEDLVLPMPTMNWKEEATA